MKILSFPSSQASKHQGRVGIIDIGSNSVRLVVYERLISAPLAVLNEKAQCGLGRKLGKTGHLHPEGVVLAKQAMRRFCLLLESMQVKDVVIAATAAVRDASDGPAFVAALEKEFGHKVRVVSGEDEGRFAAGAVARSMYDGSGVAADLGGGSLELAALQDTQVVATPVSLPLGVLRLMDQGAGYDELKKFVDEEIKQHSDLLKHMRGRALYAVGGSFRTVAKLHMTYTHYPLEVLHHYSIDAPAAKSFAGTLAKMPTEELNALLAASKKRSETLPYAALIMSRLIKYGEPSQVVFSTQGIREGLLYNWLAEKERARNPLLAGAEELAEHYGGNPAFGEVLFHWLSPLFAQEDKKLMAVRRAACSLLTIPRYEISPFQADAAFFQLLKAPLVGLTHDMRFLLALIAFHRFQFELEVPLQGWERLQVPATRLNYARLVGLAADLAFALSGGMTSLLQRTRIVPKVNELEFQCDDPGLFLTQATQKRLDRLNKALQGK